MLKASFESGGGRGINVVRSATVTFCLWIPGLFFAFFLFFFPTCVDVYQRRVGFLLEEYVSETFVYLTPAHTWNPTMTFSRSAGLFFRR